MKIVAKVVLLRICIQQVVFVLAGATSFRREPIKVEDSKTLDGIEDPDTLNATGFVSHESTAEVIPPWSVTCQRNTGRMCEASMDPGKTVVDYMGQCDMMAMEHCSTGNTFPAGYCVCSEGFCSDGSGKCVKKSGTLVNQGFWIYTEQFGPSKKLYMMPNGKVMLGQPSNPRQAEWRIVVMPDGVLNLFTNAYPYRFLDSYEYCARFTETVKCQAMVGSSIRPPAREAGWRLDRSGLKAKGAPGEEYVFLREDHSSKNLYIHPLSFEGRLCSPGDYDCPGAVGNLLFHPSIHGHVEIPITDPPPTTMESVFHYIGMGLIVVAALMLCLMNAWLDNKTSHLDDNLLTGPAKCVRCCLSCECIYGKRI